VKNLQARKIHIHSLYTFNVQFVLCSRWKTDAILHAHENNIVDSINNNIMLRSWAGLYGKKKKQCSSFWLADHTEECMRLCYGLTVANIVYDLNVYAYNMSYFVYYVVPAYSIARCHFTFFFLLRVGNRNSKYWKFYMLRAHNNSTAISYR